VEPRTTPIFLYAFAILAGAIGGLGDILLNQWAKYGGSRWWVIGGYGCWNIALTIFLYILVKGYLLNQAAALFSAANGFAIITISWFAFREGLSLISWVGVGIVFLGLALIELGK
jgi:multidrug transporter EmrE-like cation transporter